MHPIHESSKFQSELASYVVLAEASHLRVMPFECGACARHE
ncbi:BgTH12-06756 [Blumeria graminis f. sp. triticale]|uniref:BgTH12-06756 n=1 Tax=Blumeria graminis f. sp. triticale TaxID=1689686 RepID=A0A9W4DJT6_BLUGR|nr:BgTH12-06756 [Blumeria graminis f. sp. triticale]